MLIFNDILFMQVLIFNDILLIVNPKSKDKWTLLAWFDLHRIDINKDLSCDNPSQEFGVHQRCVHRLLSYSAPAMSTDILLAYCYAHLLFLMLV